MRENPRLLDAQQKVENVLESRKSLVSSNRWDTKFTVNSLYLRLLQTFAGVLQKKIRTRAVFKKTHTNYVSIERLWNVEFEKNNVLFRYSFHKATEAGKRQNDWLTFRRIYRVSNAIVDAK